MSAAARGRGRRPQGATSGARVPEVVLRRLADRAGLTFPASRLLQVQRAVERGMDRTGARTGHGYATLLDHDSAEWDELVGELTVGESYFLREPRQLRFLAREVLPRLRARSSHPPRLWSAGCADGQEAYSLAILLEQLDMSEQAHILGTDISRTRLASARRARYRPWSLRGVPPEVVREFFREREGLFQLVPRIRHAVEFRHLNLIGDAYPSDMDVVLCRNVLIYLDPVHVAAVAERLLGSLVEDGWLLLAASDPPLREYVACESVATGSGVAYRRAGRRLPTRRAPEEAPLAEPVVPGLLRAAAPDDPEPEPAEAVDPEEAELAALAPVHGPKHAVASANPETRGEPPPAVPAPIRTAYAHQEYDRVVDQVHAELQRGRDAPGLWAVLVRALANRGRLEAAERACLHALERHPTAPEIAYLHAILLAAEGRFGASTAAARRALYLDRGLAVAHLALGHALARRGSPEGAARSYRNADRLLAGMDPEATVPAGDGETAERLQRHVRTRLRLLGTAA